MHDVIIAGGGPAGLAVAIEGARRGLSVVVLERRSDPPDKACGEGVMPTGVRALERMGILARLSPGASAPFDGVRYVDTDGLSAYGRLSQSGLAIRRIALVRAMSEQARDLGVELRYGCRVDSHRCFPSEMRVQTERGSMSARMLVAADGLGSRLRRAAGLEARRPGVRRFGLRRHFARSPWSSSVEIHLADGAEAYVTPISHRLVSVAFLWSEPPARERSHSFTANPSETASRWGRLSRKFPALVERLAGAAPDSSIRGAGPFDQASSARTSDRFALVGDAAGYVDAITGEGISLSILSAVALARILPGALAVGAHRKALASYEAEFSRLFRRYEIVTRSLLSVVQRPRLRRTLLRLLQRTPSLFDFLLARAAG